MENVHKIVLTPFFVILCLHLAHAMHQPIIIRHPIEGNSASNPLIIEGYEISNPEGPCIFIENVDYVIVRNNYLHDCGTDISAELIANNPRDDDCVGMMTDFMETGALNLFRVASAKVYNNTLLNNDYGMRIDGFDRKVKGFEIFNNKIHNSHRSFFLGVQMGKNVSIYNNDIRDNGLGEFFDNAALLRILDGENLGCLDGRSQGILVHKSDDVRIYGNLVFNSSSDGIGITGDPGSPSTNIKIYNNEVVENGEQGIWLAGTHNSSIYKNEVYQSKHRIDEQGGSSGIMLETDCVNIRIFENEMYYNDMYGFSMTAGTNISVYNNEISYNGDGGIGIMHLDYIGKEGINNINISDNYLHNNRKYAIDIINDYFNNILIEGNIFEKNGGNPIHHGFYKDHDFSLHLEDGALDSRSDSERVLYLSSKEASSEITFTDNKDYLGRIIEENSIYKEQDEYEQHEYNYDADEPAGIFYVIGQVRESWQATLVTAIIMTVLLMLIAYHKRKNITSCRTTK